MGIGDVALEFEKLTTSFSVGEIPNGNWRPKLVKFDYQAVATLEKYPMGIGDGISFEGISQAKTMGWRNTQWELATRNHKNCSYYNRCVGEIPNGNWRLSDSLDLPHRVHRWRNTQWELATESARVRLGVKFLVGEIPNGNWRR